MRLVAVDRDVIVFISRVWQTTATAIRHQQEGFLIDSPVFPDELEALPGVLEQAGFPISGLLATHGDWDHLLGRLAFPQSSLGAAESTVERVEAEPGSAQRDLRSFDDEHYIERARPLQLTALQSLPVPGKLAIGTDGAQELELHAADGHTADGAAYFIPWLEVLVCGDYLSPVEIPVLGHGGSVERYGQTLDRLQPLVERARTVIPGHGEPLTSERALEILVQDRGYLDELDTKGPEARLPPGRGSRAQRKLTAENAARARLR